MHHTCCRCRYCSLNPDIQYNSCDVPQELSDEAIDKELEQGSEEVRCASISPAHLTSAMAQHILGRKTCLCLQDEAERLQRAFKQKPAVWQQVSRNIYTHREKKRETEDDIPVCDCRPPSDGKPGCGVDCINRRLNQECHPVSPNCIAN